MAISAKTQKMLWGRSAGRCAFGSCRKQLVIDSSETDDNSLVGDAAHIIASSVDGPRGDLNLSSDTKDLYSNLILLCKNHHKQIDDLPEKYTYDLLHEMKGDHEEWVRSSLTEFDAEKQRDDEIYAGYIDEWSKRAMLDEWNGWTSHILCSDTPTLLSIWDHDLYQMRKWLLNRLWPRRYPDLEHALQNFRSVLDDFQRVFRKHAISDNGGAKRFNKFYKIDRWDEKLYWGLLKRYNFQVDIISDLILELTRAANLVCEKVREYLVPNYRMNEGVLLVTSGPHAPDLSMVTRRVEYQDGEKEGQPYPGLIDFVQVRHKRDYQFGEEVDHSQVLELLELEHFEANPWS